MRLAVISPFLDRQHGTELCISEQIDRFASQNHWQIELYSQKVEHLRGICSTFRESDPAQESIIWHKVSHIPGPHLLKYLWWFFANQRLRRQDRRSGKVRPDLVYSPGINCLDADVIVVHIVFHDFYARVKPQLALSRMPVLSWPRVIHRKLYYRLVMFLERKVYSNSRTHLIAVSSLVAGQLKTHFQRADVPVIPNGVDASCFAPQARQAAREQWRKSFEFSERDFVLLVIGNDWKKKGLDCLLQALAHLKGLPLRLIVVGSDDPAFYRSAVKNLQLQARVRFEKPVRDVLRFYAAADLYVAPSLEDAFNLPILEAMACGLPVIASVNAGASELIIDSQTGLLLRNPEDPLLLARLVRQLFEDASLRLKISNAAPQYARENCSWDQNATRTRQFLETVLQKLHRA